MASQCGYEYYREDFQKMSPLRAMAETLFAQRNDANTPELVTPARAYELARKQPGVMVTDVPICETARRRLGLPTGSTVLNYCNDKIATPPNTFFYHSAPTDEQAKMEQLANKAGHQLQNQSLLIAEVVLGIDADLMIKARMLTPMSNANNAWNWLHNFAAYQAYAQQYQQSRKLAIQDILLVSNPQWQNSQKEFANGVIIVDPYENVVFNFGSTNFQTHRECMLILAWTSGVRLRQVACHGGVKEVDFTSCEEEKHRSLGKCTIAFCGSNASGKSTHINSHDHCRSLPGGVQQSLLHDGAFEIDWRAKVCRVWEVAIFDKTQKLQLEHGNWQYCLSSHNNAIIEDHGKRIILPLDIRNANGRCIFDREIFGKDQVLNRCEFPVALCWLMQDKVLPPIIRINSPDLAVAMGATIVNQEPDNQAQPTANLEFVPFANPYRAYELHRECNGFIKIFEAGTLCFIMNSGGFWGGVDKPVVDIPVETSLRLHTAILCDELTWEPWSLFPDMEIPTSDSVDAIVDNYSTNFSPDKVVDAEAYQYLLQTRLQQRYDYLDNSDLQERPQLLQRLLTALAQD